MSPPPSISTRRPDGSAGDADYGRIGRNYSHYRQPEPHIATYINAALGPGHHVLNVGAGAGSYEPIDRHVIAVEPSAAMRAQRPAHLSRAIDAVAEKLPFPDDYFDAGLATFTIHQWSDVPAGLAEMRRVTRAPVVILTCDPHQVTRFWLQAYAPRVLSAEARRYPEISYMMSLLGGIAEITSVRIPLYCQDGFNEAYYGRPERLLEPGARLACSAWSFIEPAIVLRYIDHLRRDLSDGT